MHDEFNLELIKEKFKTQDVNFKRIEDAIKQLEDKYQTAQVDLSKLNQVIDSLNDTNEAVKELVATIKKDYVLKEVCSKNVELTTASGNVTKDRLKNLEEENRHIKWLIYGAVAAEVFRLIFSR